MDCEYIMKISAGVIIINEFNEVFLSKVTGQPQHDIPKGLIDDGELPIDSAIRETMEETNIKLNKDDLIDLGVFDYIKNKKLHLFINYVKKSDIDMSSLKCISFFEDKYTKKMNLEVEGYIWVESNRLIEYATKNMYNVLNPILNKILSEKNFKFRKK